MTPIELVESDDDQEKGESETTREESKTTRVSSGARAIEELYGEPQHEVGHQPVEQKAALYGEPQHEELAECRWGEPFPWLLEDDEEEERRATRTKTVLPLCRLDRDRPARRR